ncbi:MAG: 8-oxo-dGTP diphosphatase MutT [Spirulinaceae cyanobacterium]
MERNLLQKRIGVAVITNNQGEILIDRRPRDAEMGGLWEFPGGKVEPSETVEECIKREIKEELALDIEVGQHLISVNYTYPQVHISLIVHYCRHQGGDLQPLASQEVRWVSLTEIANFEFPEANQQIITALQQGNRK